ncbi:uncharacterized protein LOC123679651 [Harmonia axyridis]|uniref:uncharacterized protein LOC123679651 n=1 Tax=Harmonia axyridis TaxID=115357 RepID=UPI001E279867|nr:uncharacterized protein LOC123679651 [Harmonia axyridis]
MWNMALFHVFLFWFSVRLGSIIIGVLTAIQGAVWLVHLIYCLNSGSQFSNHLKTIFDDFGFHGNVFDEIIKDPSDLITIFIVYFVSLMMSSVSLIWGALQIQVKMMYPFIALYIFYIGILGIQLTVFIMGLKSNESGLGDMILFSNLGSFILLFYLYKWAVVISFIQIVKELKRRMEKKPLLVKEAEKKIINTISNNLNMKEAYIQYIKSFSK